MVRFAALLPMPLVEAARQRPREPGDPALMFVNTRGGRIQNGAFHAHQWDPALTRASEAGLTQRPRIHDLRHSHASLMLAEGTSMYAVSRRDVLHRGRLQQRDGATAPGGYLARPRLRRPGGTALDDLPARDVPAASIVPVWVAQRLGGADAAGSRL